MKRSVTCRRRQVCSWSCLRMGYITVTQAAIRRNPSTYPDAFPVEHRLIHFPQILQPSYRERRHNLRLQIKHFQPRRRPRRNAYDRRMGNTQPHKRQGHKHRHRVQIGYPPSPARGLCRHFRELHKSVVPADRLSDPGRSAGVSGRRMPLHVV